MMERIFVYGAGGQGKVVLDALHSGPPQLQVGLIVDDDPRHYGKTLMGHPITAPVEIGAERGFIAIGKNDARLRIASRYKGRLVVIAHRASVISQDVSVGEGTIFMPGSIVCTGSRIGENVIVNTCASVDHDCVIEDGVHIAPGTRLCGNVRVGRGTLLGAGTIVVPGVRIGRDAFVHAGVTITHDVADGEVVRGPRPKNADAKSPRPPSRPAPERITHVP